jgi:hypothetical protein
MRATVMITAMLVVLSASGAMAATATCANLVSDSQTAERSALEGANEMAHQTVSISRTDIDYQLTKLFKAAILGRATLAACAAPGDQSVAADIRKWVPVQDAAATAALKEKDNCRAILYVVQSVMEGAQEEGGDQARLNYLVAAALQTNNATRTACPDFADNIDDFAKFGAARLAHKTP